MKTIKLYGDLAEKYGDEYRLDVVTPAEAIRAIGAQVKGFLETIREGEFHLVRGEDLELTDPKHLNLSLGKCSEFHIIPAAVGAKRGGLGKAIIGIAILAVAFYAAPVAIGGGAAVAGGSGGLAATAATVAGFSISYGNIALFGLSMALQGIGSMLTPVPKVNDYGVRERPEERPSFLATGPVNTVEQGTCVPIVYGETYTGSVVISGSLTTEQIAVDA